ncbi:TatD family hydrolase [Enterovibrio sp. ZSDZ35]|uniref:TatD family hydrolase n=1 Tax=Enterovibrio qingdaonensis TaxID=2899818 RepID=A0ABT5QUN3_9GAMM|nr:TatD family hydrolase [Enterovibrio sp. ZSDZ35]MDD1784443.1 TatD family hydrolase [Enterovibrio sp. ZSDZ35]
MIDTHCHFDFEPFNTETDEWIKRTELAGVVRLIVPAVATSNWARIEMLATRFPAIYFAVGLHPVWVAEHSEEHIEKLDQYLSSKPAKCVAVGECGLDFAISDHDPEKQIAILEAQLSLADKYNLPVILHCRKAHNEMLQLLTRFPSVKGVLHAFSGSEQQAMDYIKRGFLLGVGGTITYERANKTRNAIARLPLSSLVLETDAPDMPISGYQGEANLPERLPLIAQALSEIRAVNVEVIIQATSQNALKCFALNR